MITSILLLRFKALTSFFNKVKQIVIRILHFNYRTPILGTMDPMQWPPPPTPSWWILVSQGQKISSWTSAYFGFWRREGEVFSSFSNKVKQNVIRILHFNHRNPILGTMNPMQWPPSPHPTLVKSWKYPVGLQHIFSSWGTEGKGRYCQCFEELLPVLYLKTSDETRLSNVHFSWH